MEVVSLHVYDIYTKYYFHWCLNFCSLVKIEPLDFDLNSILAFDLNLSSCTPKVFDNRYILMFYNLSGTPEARAIGAMAEGQPCERYWNQSLESRSGLGRSSLS